MVSDSARNRMENSDVPGHDFKKLCPRILSLTIYNSWDFRSALREKKNAAITIPVFPGRDWLHKQNNFSAVS